MSRVQKLKPAPFRVGIYVRVSTEEQAENPEGSIKNQEQRLREFVKLKNMVEPFGEVAKVYTDILSAKDMNRPGFQRMLQAIATKEINLVLVTEISRFSRSTKDFSMLQEFLEEHECKFLSIRENFDTSGAAGQMVLNMMATIAEFERRQTAERISNSFHARAKRGLYNGGSVPLGYRIDEDKPGNLTIVPEESEVVKLIFKTFLREGTLAATAKWLNNENVKFPRRVLGGGHVRSKLLRIDMLYRVLRNKAYVGTRVFKSKGGVEESTAVWLPIIDMGTFQRANDKLKDNCSRRTTHWNKLPYLLTGLVSCQECGERMAGASATSQSGHKVGYYEHAATRKNEASLKQKLLKHGPRRIPIAKIEPVVWTETKRFILENGFAKDLLARARTMHGTIEKESRRRELKAKESALERQITVLAERIAKLPESIDPEPLIEQLGDLQVAKKKLQLEVKQSATEEALTDEPVSFENLEKFREGLRDLIKKGESDPTIKSAIIKTVVHRILILKDGFEVHFHVGQTHYSALGDSPGASFFVSFSYPKNKKPPAGIPTEGKEPSLSGSELQASRFLKVSSSRRLTNGGPDRDRTCDLKHAMLPLSQLSYRPTPFLQTSVLACGFLGCLGCSAFLFFNGPRVAKLWP